MQTQRINISLPHPILRAFQSQIPPGKRSKFIAQALSEKLEKKRNLKKELIRSLKANRKLDEAIMKEWSTIEVEGWPD